MITSKQRSFLKSMAHHDRALLQIGKTGVSESLLEQLDKLLEDHELVKINVLKNCPFELEELVEEVLEATGSDFVQKIGRKFTIYRPAKEPVIELPKTR